MSIDTTAPFALLVCTDPDFFGIVTDNKGVMQADANINKFVEYFSEQERDINSRDHTWRASQTLFKLSFPLAAITVDNHEHVLKLTPPAPLSLASKSTPAGNMTIIKCDRELFTDVLQRGVHL